MKPNFEEPLDTAKQLVERNIKILLNPDIGENNRQSLLDSPIPEFKILGENAVIADDWYQYDDMMRYDIMGAGTHAIIDYMVNWDAENIGRKYHPDNRNITWYASKEKVGGEWTPYAGYIANKKWHLNEVLSKIKYT